MANEEITSKDVETISEAAAPADDGSHPLVGLPDGHVDHNNEKIVYEYDADGNFTGWHKEATE